MALAGEAMAGGGRRQSQEAMERGWTIGDWERQNQLRLICKTKESCSRYEEQSAIEMCRSAGRAVSECGRCIATFLKGQEKDLPLVEV